jgi:hypothetical protein
VLCGEVSRSVKAGILPALFNRVLDSLLHSLGDSFDRQLGNSPTKFSGDLWAEEISVLEEITQN